MNANTNDLLWERMWELTDQFNEPATSVGDGGVNLTALRKAFDKLQHELRFWSKVRKTKTCWLWCGSHKEGYGVAIHAGGMSRTGAHRISWEMHYGELPAGQRVLHTCHVRECVNPKHLFLGEQHERSRAGMRVVKEALGGFHEA